MLDVKSRIYSDEVQVHRDMARRSLDVYTVQFRASGKLWGIMLTL